MVAARYPPFVDQLGSLGALSRPHPNAVRASLPWRPKKLPSLMFLMLHMPSSGQPHLLARPYIYLNNQTIKFTDQSTVRPTDAALTGLCLLTTLLTYLSLCYHFFHYLYITAIIIAWSKAGADLDLGKVGAFITVLVFAPSFFCSVFVYARREARSESDGNP
ncbi:hypothetical protein VTI28DRAFT_5050 [Corynascus sepedonium]